VGTDSDRAASSLLSQLDRRWRNDGKLSIPSTTSIPAARHGVLLINLQAGLGTRLVSANSIASQLVKNEAHKTRDRESTKLVNKVIDLWKVPTAEGSSISSPFTPEELVTPITWSQENLMHLILFSQSLYSAPDRTVAKNFQLEGFTFVPGP